MSDKDFTRTITVDRTPDQAWAAINDVRGWWSRTADGGSGTVGDSYVFDVPGVHHCRMTTVEAEPGRRLVWRVSDAFLAFVDDTAEWEGTTVEFDLTPRPGGTEIRFTHVGLAPRAECYEVCADAWNGFVTDSLRGLLETGAGAPMTGTEQIDVAALRRAG
ncbi:SRPBCC family protein [Nocardia thailandica]|uniref:SRPBCC domain-containing protein n=1 Tax=Nocardia thailandica TaxID=257275 RepID=A0ABW6PQI7_9NOCA|nr:SRPBCC domain-containing protein [Nocardia thailandica]